MQGFDANDLHLHLPKLALWARFRPDVKICAPFDATLQYKLWKKRTKWGKINKLGEESRDAA